MNTKAQVRRAVRLLAALGLVCALAAPAVAMSTARKKELALQHFDSAEKQREALNGRPLKERTRRDYNRVIDAYRRVYFTAPTSSKADASVVAAAELMVEVGRNFNDDKTLQDAITQYEFLRREYPGSKYRVDALYTIAEIYKEDLQDREQATAAFQEFLKHYPRSQQASDARDALAELEKPAGKANSKQAESKASAKNTVAGKKTSAKDKTADGKPAPTAEKQSVAVTATEKKSKEVAKDTQARDDENPVDEDETPVAAGKKHGIPVVSGIRHWSTPDYTRVAIDLDEEVKYEAGRVPNPDRIFFDLHDTKLASILKGKTFDVEDGFLKKIRVAQYQAGTTRVVLEVDDVAEYSAFFLPNPSRLIIDIHGKKPAVAVAKVVPDAAKPAPKAVEKPAETRAAGAETAKKTAPPVVSNPPKPATEVAAKPAPGEVKPAPKEAAAGGKTAVTTTAATSSAPKKIDDGGATLVADASMSPSAVKDTAKPTTAPTVEEVTPRAKKKGKQAKEPKPQPEIAGHEAQPTSNGDRSLIRALGLKIGKIVVDAGHGGHDTGTIGPNGLEEKDLVLDVAQRLGKLLEGRLGADVVYTRDDDTFIPLETRTAIANQAEADLFISIHANSSRDASARGVETYYLNFTSSRDALEVAARENAVSEKSIHELQDLVKKIALKEKIEESHEFAADVQTSLYSGLVAKNPGLRNRGVKKAPFIVLIGANMPSILAEISFVSNPRDEQRLMTPDYRQKIAESLYKGISKYVSGLSGLKVATRMAKQEGE